jgi:acyl-CoA thioesterase
MRFDAASAVTRAADGEWTAEVQPTWDIFGVVNGGYLMAIAARAMSDAADGRIPVSVTSYFVSPVTPGAVRIGVETVKVGRTFSTMAARMVAERDTMSLMGTFTAPESLNRESLYSSGHPPEMPPPEECPRAVPAEDGPLPPPLLGHFEERLHPDDADALVRPSGEATMRGWFRLENGERLDPFTLLLVADAFPPAVFNANLPLAWTPTVEMTTQIRAVPVEGWLRCRFTTRFVTGGLLEEDGEIWDESDRLVALSRQLALVPR